ncbi:unnamed protein product [Lymnaea stagnalis]|uniref:Uncharacterized protein n=1 Tax=Lymnaea stagnalis TaxID=6523 RepID=A0AAV2I6P6_LYMST
MGNAWNRLQHAQQTIPKAIIEPTSPDETTISNLWYNVTLRDKIVEVFVEYIRPWNVLQVFHKYNRRVLVRQDVEFVKAQVNNLGDRVGSQTLLERLSIYEGWFDCLISTLKDREVMLDHVAQTFQNLKDDLDYEILNDQEPENSSGLETDSSHKPKTGDGVLERLKKDNLRLMIKLEKMTNNYERERTAREKLEVQVNVLQSELEASQSDPEYKTFAVKLKQLQDDFEDVVRERDYLRVELDESRVRSEQDCQAYEEKVKQLLSDFEAQRRERELSNQKQGQGKGKHKKKLKPPSCFNGH